jgi:hypothetical protein
VITEEEARAAAYVIKSATDHEETEWRDHNWSILAQYAIQQLARLDSEKPERVNYWLAERNQYGIADVFLDGPHSGREGVEKALYLINSLGLNRSTKNRDLCCVRVEQTSVEPKCHNANEEAIAACREMMK